MSNILRMTPEQLAQFRQRNALVRAPQITGVANAHDPVIAEIDAMRRELAREVLDTTFLSMCTHTNGNAAEEPKRKPAAVRLPCVATSAAKPPIATEREILKACIRILALDSRVAWAHRMNAGAYVAEGARFVRFGFKGCSDIIGQMSDGRFLAIEVKRESGRVTEDQLAFLGRVSRAGGVAFVARSVDDVRRGLK